MLDDRELTMRCAIGMAETLLAQVTSAARRLRCFETGNAIAVEEHVLAGAVELVPCRPDAASACFVVDEVFDGEQFRAGVLARFTFAPATQTSFLLFALLVSRRPCKRWLSFPIVSVCDVSVSASCLHSSNNHVAVKTTIGGYLCVSENVLL